MEFGFAGIATALEMSEVRLKVRTSSGFIVQVSYGMGVFPDFSGLAVRWRLLSLR